MRHLPVVIAKPGEDTKLRNFYPWLYAHEISGIEGEAAAGDVVDVRDSNGASIGRAFYSPSSHIAVRMLSLDPSVEINRAFFMERLKVASARRTGRISGTNAMRLVHGEADELPGLIVDRFADTLVIQLRNPGMDRHRDDIVRALKNEFQPSGIYERSDVQARTEEGLEPRVGAAFGQVPEVVDVIEGEIHFQVNIRSGQKTGFYLDQRDNRRMLGQMVKPGDRVLDVYSYTGGFSLHSAHAGANALAVDKDSDALKMLEMNAIANSLSDRIGARWGDALEVMVDLAKEGRSFDYVVLDPPTLVKQKRDLPNAKGLFAKMVGNALAVLEPGGVLLLSTCAYHITTLDLLEVTRRAASDAHRRVQVLDITYQPPDHPWVLHIPETLYLKTIILRVD